MTAGSDVRSISLEESYAHCRRLARRTGRNFYFSFLTLPRDRFRAMCVLYAFMRVSDDIGDDPACPVEQRREQLADWRGALDAALQDQTVSHPVLPALADVVHRYEIPPQYLHDVLHGIETDLTPRTFATFADLADYCYHVAGAVGLCCIHIWGFHDDRAKDRAIDCGLAFQLTNVLRDLKEDSRLGRTYLPAEDLDRFGYTPEDIAAGCIDDRFRALMQFEVARAREYYEKARLLFDQLDPAGRAIFDAMLRIYGRLLDEIERRGYDVYSRRVKVSRWRKLTIAAGSVLRHRLRPRTQRRTL